MAGFDVLERVIPVARARNMQVYVEVMEPILEYAGHGSVNNVAIPNLPQALEVDLFGRIGSEPSTVNPDYRNWILGMVEDQVRNYDLDGVMWCNERRSPLDQMIAGQAPTDFGAATRREAHERGIDVERVRAALREVWDYFERARAGEPFVDGALVEFLRVMLRNPEALVWERYWSAQPGPRPRAVRPGEVVRPGAFVRPQRLEPQPLQPHPQGAVAVGGPDPLRRLGEAHHLPAPVRPRLRERDDGFPPECPAGLHAAEPIPHMYKLLGLHEAPWDEVVQTGMDPDTYVYGQCADAVRGVDGLSKVYMGIGVDAPRSRKDQAACMLDIVRRSVLATYRAGGEGVVFAPNYASMKLTNWTRR